MSITEGEWYVDGRFIKTTAQKTKIIAEVPQDGVIHRKIDQANAHLMAAAPQLYKACKSLQRYRKAVEEGRCSNEESAEWWEVVMDEAEAAVSAAEGKE